MPLGEAYDALIKSDIADMKNVGGRRAGGSITAAQFIKRFVDGRPWAHLDIAGVAWGTKDQPTAPKGATAWGVRLLDRLVADHHEGGTQPAPVPAGTEGAALAGAGTSPAMLAEGGGAATAPQPDLSASGTAEPSLETPARPRGKGRKNRG